MHRSHRRTLLVLGALAAALALTGCVRLTSFTGSQPSPVSGVQIASVLCRSGSAGCADGGGNSGLTPTADATVQVQVLIGYRVTAGSRPPAELRFFDDDGIGPLFTPSPSYTAELQRLAPAPAGQQWFGYLSTQFASTPAVTQGAVITRFGLPTAPDGTPFSSTYTYLVVVGAREADAMNDPARPVWCGDSLFAVNDRGVCVDSPVPSDVTSWKTLAVRDLGVGAGPSAPVTAGGTATVPFVLRTTAGVPAGTTAALSAVTGVPSGTATVAPGSVALAPAAAAQATVRVAVPPGVAPGSYPVTLTATVGADVRTGQGTVTVVPPGAAGGGPGGGAAGSVPTLTAKVAPKAVGRGRRAAPAIVTAVLSEPGTVRMAVTRAVPGRRRANGACAAPTRALVRAGARRCTRFAPVATITRAGLAAGANRIAFSGRGRAAGRYRLSLTLRAGGRTSRPAVVAVTVRAS